MITITPTAPQQAKLDEALIYVNEQRAAQVPPLPALNENQWAGMELLQRVKAILSESGSNKVHKLAVAYENATPAQRTAARNALGLP